VSVLNTVHFVLAFLVLLCAVVFGWSSRGRRVINAVLGLQFLCGVALAAWFASEQHALPAQLWPHLGATVAAMLAYGFARRLGDRDGGAPAGLGLSAAGLLCVCAALYLGLRMAGQT
jgi:hypothetical protein